MGNIVILPTQVPAVEAFITGTSSFGISENGGVPSGQILYDESDDTFYGISSSSAFDPSLGCQFPDIGGTVPRNVENLVVTFVPRLRINTISAGGCPVEDVLPTTEVWVSLDGTDTQYATLGLTAGFSDLNAVLPLEPAGVPWDITDLPRSYYGLRARSDCPSAPGVLPLRINWSKARLSLTYTLPTPVLTILTPEDLTAHSVVLRATINPNQTGSGLVGPPDGYPVQWGFEIGLSAITMSTATFSGALLGDDDILVRSEVSSLTPGTTYYYRFAARVDGVTTYSTTTTVTLPFTDPVKGVY